MELSESLLGNIEHARSLEHLPSHQYQSLYEHIGGLLDKQYTMHQGKPWCIFYSDENVRSEISFGEFVQQVRQTANLLLSKGVGRGDRVGVISFNHPDSVIQYFAVWLIGGVVVPINSGEDDTRIEYILTNSATTLVFVREQYVERIEKVLEHIPSSSIIIIRSGNALSLALKNEYEVYDEVRSHFHTTLDLNDTPTLEDDALIVYTSGTTGMPKGVVLTQYNLLTDAKEIAQWHTITPHSRMMCVLPLHHVNGIVVTLMTPFYAGASVVLNQKFHSGVFFTRVQNEGVHIVSVVPTLLQFLLHEETAITKNNIPTLRHIICGAGPLTVELAMKFEERFGIPVMHGYGLSETTCYSCFLPVDLTEEEHKHWLKDFGFPSIGVAIPSNEMAIHNSEGKELGEKEKGEIVIRGHNVMKYYFGNAEVNEKTFSFGWFRSGDEGFYALDGLGRKYFFITGRIKELIIRGGVNISPFAIDEVLMNIPGVKAGLAVGFDNDWYGEEVGAYVKLQENVSLTEEDIMNYCRKYFSFSHSPKVVVFGNDIPVTSTGKYQRSKLKSLFEPWKRVQFKEKKKRGE